jgi:hypothetical protein
MLKKSPPLNGVALIDTKNNNSSIISPGRGDFYNKALPTGEGWVGLVQSTQQEKSV